MRLAPQEIEGNMAQHCKGLHSLVFANPRGIFSKGDIQDPMESVRNPPVLPHRLSKPYALRREGRQKISCIDWHRVPDFPTRFDHPHALQVGPGRLCTKPYNLRCDPIATRFNTTVI